MSPNLNKVILIGKVKGKPTLRLLDTTNAVGNFTIVTEDIFIDSKTGEKKITNDWHSIVTWGNQAKLISENISENMIVYVEGKLKYKNWTTKNNEKHYRSEIFLTDFKILSQNNTEKNKPNNEIYPVEKEIPKPKKLDGFDSSELDEIPF